MGAFGHLKWTHNGAFEQLFGLRRGEFEQNFPKSQMHGGLPGGGGMLKLQFDWYITMRALILESIEVYSLQTNKHCYQ